MSKSTAVFKTAADSLKESTSWVHPPWRVLWHRDRWRRVGNANNEAVNRRPALGRVYSEAVRVYFRPLVPRILPHPKRIPYLFYPLLAVGALLYYGEWERIKQDCPCSERDCCPAERFRSQYVEQPCRPEVRNIREMVPDDD